MRCAAIALTLGMASSTAFTQAPAGGGNRRTFEVASVKPNLSPDARLSFGGPPGRYEILNAPLRTIIRVAHQVQDYQIVEAPGWIASTDRAATRNGGAPASALPIGPGSIDRFAA